MTRAPKLWLGVIVVAAAFALYLVDLPQPTRLPAVLDRPLSHGNTALRVVPDTVRPGDVITLHITAPGVDGGVTYGAKYVLDAEQRGGWRYRFIGGDGVFGAPSEPASPQTQMFFEASARFGPHAVRIRVPDVEPGRYRVRKEFFDAGAQEAFELAAPFRVV